MYSIIDLCLICLRSSKKLKSILAQDSDGLVIEEKCRYVLFEFNSIKPEVSNNICLECLHNLNKIYYYNLQCLKNIIKLNDYLNKLRNCEGSYKHLQVSLTDAKNRKFTKTSCLNSNNVTQQDSTESNEIWKNEVCEEILPDELFRLVEVELVEKDNDIEIKEETNIIEYHAIQEYAFKKEDDSLDIEDKFTADENSEAICTELQNVQYELLSEETSVDNLLNDLHSSATKITDIFIADENSEDICTELQNVQYKLLSEETSVENLLNDPLHSSATKSTDCNQTSTDFGKYSELDNKNARRKSQFKCNECYKAFPQLSKLKVHSRVHTEERPFKCTTCHKKFKQRHHLNSHKLTHTGEKPYACDICHKNFNRNSNLVAHKRIHNNVRPFKCSFCHRPFKHKNDLTKHVKIHTAEEQYVFVINNT